MKKIIALLGIIITVNTCLFAQYNDVIYYKNGIRFLCKIKKTTDSTIIYERDGQQYVIDKEKDVAKIMKDETVFLNGTFFKDTDYDEAVSESIYKDVIYLKDSNHIVCKVKNVSDSTVTYMKYNKEYVIDKNRDIVIIKINDTAYLDKYYHQEDDYYQPEPEKTTKRNTTSKDTITYARIGGEYKYSIKGEFIKPAYMLSLMKDYPEAYRYMKAAKTNRDIGMVVSSAGGFLIGWPLGAVMGGGEMNWIIFGMGGTLNLFSIPLISGWNKNSIKAVNLYNSKVKK